MTSVSGISTDTSETLVSEPVQENVASFVTELDTTDHIASDNKLDNNNVGAGMEITEFTQQTAQANMSHHEQQMSEVTNKKYFS